MADRASGILLDTSAVIAQFRGRIEIFALTTPFEQLFLPLVALGELYKGVEKSGRPEMHRQMLDKFLRLVTVLYPDNATAERYARISVDLERSGRIIPENDMWIAAAAMECDLPLATRDAHFERVNGLDVIRW